MASDARPVADGDAEAVPFSRPHVVGVVSDGCLNDAPSILEGHADWNLAVFAGRRCDGPFPDSVGGTTLVSPCSRLSTSARVAFTWLNL